MIEFVYPYWFIIFCVLLGLGYSVILYRKDNTFGGHKKAITYILGILRFFSVFILSLFILEPLIQTEDKIIEKPIIVIAQDNSESIKLSKDSIFYNNEYPKQLKLLKNNLSNNYNVETYSFGEKTFDSLKFNYDFKQTDISELLKNIEHKYYGRNLGGIIIASDGIINKGTNPEYNIKNIENTLVYTIAMGDTSIKKDLIINSIHNNNIAYKGNDFPVEVNLKAYNLSTEKTKISIWHNNKKINEKEIKIDKNNYSKNVKFIVPAQKSGKQKYNVKVSNIYDELTFLNNSKNFYISIIENKQNVLILANAPHPDITAIKNVLDKNKNYNVTVGLIDNFDKNLEEYNLVILHGLPSKNTNRKDVIEELINNKIPLLICATEHTDYNYVNNLNKQLKIIGANGFSNSNAEFNKGFNKFVISEPLINSITNYPPLQVPFTTGYKIGQKNNIFLTQKIGNVKTDYPLFVFNNNENHKIGLLLGEGIWKWKYLNFLNNNNDIQFDELIQKPIQYLVAKKDKSKFKITNKDIILENENLIINAELYNDSYELINNTDVIIKIIDSKGVEYQNKTMSKYGNRYRLNAGKFNFGEYTYIATTSFDGKTYKSKGQFSVKELKDEYTNLIANHKLLYKLAISKNGNMFYPNQLKELEKEILKQENITPISYIKKNVQDLIKWKWIFAIIILLLSTEWFLRKRSGGY